MASQEFLEEIWREAKKHLPGWVYASLLQSARPRAGGRSSHRTDEPDVFAKLALEEIKPARLSKVSDDELGAVWLRLNQWFSNAKKRKRAVEDFVNAGLWTKAELEKRGKKIQASDFVEEIERLEGLKKEREESVRGKEGKLPKFIGDRLDKIPDEVVLVRDFVSIAGSAAVAEKPNDIDVVIRADFDSGRGDYYLDGRSLGVALRRFLSPDKKGPQASLLGAPQGSFTDYVPVFDLVARKRASGVVKVEPEPPDYPGQDRVIKQEARAAEAGIRAQAERAKAQDKLTLGEFFYQPKPTRPAFAEEPQTVDRLVELYKERAERWLPAWVQKKYDGANHQIHKDGDRVKIYSEDGDDNTDRLPSIVEAVKKLAPKELILPAEIEFWEGKQHYPRERVAGYLAEKGEPDDSKLVANVYDVIWKDGDLHSEPYEKRLEALRSLGGGTMGPPGRRALNFAPGEKVETPEEVRAATERIRKLPGSEGVVIKRLDSAYPLAPTSSDAWVKFHNNSQIRGIVTKSKRTKGGVFVLSYGVKPGRERPEIQVSGDLVPVGDTFATARKFSPGDKVLIEAESVNKIVGPDGVKVSAWVPRVLGSYDSEPDSVDTMTNRAAENLVLQVKRADEKGEIVEYLPANVLKAELRPEVPTVGPEKALVAFVGASPGRVEAARREPFIGPGGETFREVYLKPLDLKREEVVIMNAVPKLLLDERGRTREPTDEEIADWRGWLSKELETKRPKVVVALGQTAGRALGDRADLVVPHPSAVRRFGDSGEVGRKLKRIKEQVSKQADEKPSDEGGTRSARASNNWDLHWVEGLPTSGKGRFVYQHHWRGLGEDELKLDDEQLLDSSHSLHGDLRFSNGKGSLWGFTAFLGETADNKARGGDKLIGWKAGDNIEAAPKLNQPESWLEVGVEKKPYISEPGQVGATSEKYSKFFALDKGTYEMGVARKHMVEIFLDGGKLKGRYLIMFAPVAGRRRWLIDRPEDQEPMATRRDLSDVIGELRHKGQKWLYWAAPGERPQVIDVRTGKALRKSTRIVKADPIKQIVYGAVLDPYGEDGPQEDAHNDWTPPADVEKAAHNWLKSSRIVGLQHNGKAEAVPVESWIEPYPDGEYQKAMRGEDHKIYRRKFGSDFLHSGSWVLGVKLGAKEWALYKQGKINAFSPGGFGVRSPLSRRDMPKVDIVDLIERPKAKV